MPKGQAFDLEVTKLLSKEKVKKEAEAGATVWTPGAGKRFRLLGFILVASEADTFALTDGSTEFFKFAVPKTPTAVVFNFPAQGYLSIKDANKLIITGGSAEREVTGTFYGIEDVA